MTNESIENCEHESSYPIAYSGINGFLILECGECGDILWEKLEEVNLKE